MTDRREIQHLYHLLMQLPKEKREELMVDEFELAHGKEPEGDTERANWYRAAFSRLLQPGWRRAIVNDGDSGPEFEEVLERVQEAVAVHQADGADVGVMSE